MVADIQLRSRFFDTLDWLCHVMTRHPEALNLALVRISYGEDNSLGEMYGAPEALRQLSQLTINMQNTFRKSDLVGRVGTDFWVLFPYTGVSENLLEKLMDILQEAAHQRLNIVDREIAVFELTKIFKNNNISPESGESFIEHLKQHQAALASHSFKLAPDPTQLYS